MPSGCRLLPHGGYTLIPATLSTMAWIASLSQDGCDYARLSGSSVVALTNSDTIPFLEVGFNGYRNPDYDPTKGEWKVDYTSNCNEYDGVDIDISWRLAQAFAFVALVFGGGAALFLWFSSCFVFGPGTWRWAGYEVLAASLFQAASFIWFNNAMCKSGNNCGLFFGSKADIVAASFWFASAIFIFVRYPIPGDKERTVASAFGLPTDGTRRVMTQVGDENDSVISDPDPGTKFPRADMI